MFFLGVGKQQTAHSVESSSLGDQACLTHGLGPKSLMHLTSWCSHPALSGDNEGDPSAPFG